MDRRDRLRIVAAGVEVRHPHAAETDCRYARAAGAKRARGHGLRARGRAACGDPADAGQQRSGERRNARGGSPCASARCGAQQQRHGAGEHAAGADDPAARRLRAAARARGSSRVSIAAPMSVSTAAAPKAMSFSAGSSWPEQREHRCRRLRCRTRRNASAAARRSRSTPGSRSRR